MDAAVDRRRVEREQVERSTALLFEGIEAARKVEEDGIWKRSTELEAKIKTNRQRMV